jgi:hypothetical protein
VEKKLSMAANSWAAPAADRSSNAPHAEEPGSKNPFR